MKRANYLKKLNQWNDEAKCLIQAKFCHVTISKGNKKMGYIKSASTPAILTCRRCGCSMNKDGEIECYACYGQTGMRSAQLSYAKNLHIYKTNPERYFREIADVAFYEHFFRYSVSGDIVDEGYLDGMVWVAEQCHGTKFLCFTKKYELVNRWIVKHGKLPSNLQVVFSVWDDLYCDNPYNFPTAHVIYYDRTTTASKDAFNCPDDCMSCTKAGVGCWAMQKGQQVVFKQHGGKKKHLRKSQKI